MSAMVNSYIVRLLVSRIVSCVEEFRIFALPVAGSPWLAITFLIVIWAAMLRTNVGSIQVAQQVDDSCCREETHIDFSDQPKQGEVVQHPTAVLSVPLYVLKNLSLTAFAAVSQPLS